MHPINRAAGISAVVIALGSRAPRAVSGGTGIAAGTRGSVSATGVASRDRAGSDGAASPGSEALGALVGLSSICPPGTLPDGVVCVEVPSADTEGLDELIAFPGAHVDKRGRYNTYDQIPRRPERPAAYEAYRYPIPIPKDTPLSMSGYDLDRPDQDQRRGRKFSHVGHGGVDLPGARGTEVRVLSLEHQEGDAEVLLAGKLFGTTVITKHTLREGGRLRDYIVLYGHLDRIAVGVSADRGRAPEGTLLGYVGDTGSEGVVHLHLEVRRVRDGVDVNSNKIRGERLIAEDISVVCDPRNVLPLQ